MNNELLQRLVCPQDHAELDWQEEAQELRCQSCKLAFAVRDGVPNMLIDEATPLSA